MTIVRQQIGFIHDDEPIPEPVATAEPEPPTDAPERPRKALGYAKVEAARKEAQKRRERVSETLSEADDRHRLMYQDLYAAMHTGLPRTISEAHRRHIANYLASALAQVLSKAQCEQPTEQPDMAMMATGIATTITALGVLP